jgi:hypothetical protein
LQVHTPLTVRPHLVTIQGGGKEDDGDDDDDEDDDDEDEDAAGWTPELVGWWVVG